MVSFYARVNYSLASKYLFTFSIRTDGSSKFSPATRWGVFPSGAFAWNAKEESFLKDVSWLSVLKLRLSAGVTGQQDGIDDYVHLARYGLSSDSYSRYQMGTDAEGKPIYSYWLTPQAYDPDIKWLTHEDDEDGDICTFRGKAYGGKRVARSLLFYFGVDDTDIDEILGEGDYNKTYENVTVSSFSENEHKHIKIRFDKTV
jgi:hypothetical protein